MKKIYLTLLLTIFTICLKATTFTVSIVGNTYSPATLTVTIGDIVTIEANSSHPLVEVSQGTWLANGTASLSTGFGVKTSSYTFTITSTNTIYYVCQSHANIGMKGQFIVNSAGINEQDYIIESISLSPNPAKEKFSVKFKSPGNGELTSKLYSICGQEIQTLITNKEFNTGENIFTFELKNTVPSGVYFVQLDYNSKKIVKKIIIIN